ncbi:hypothetical protein KGF54_000259 [Candida jiufengensis]|uniref:uncharacterized protein n=1 Tax=Candida jiufengensis TaxID=497108 RepID=UPI002224CFAC|nr:uncharacterized protein KGF54_000259 [Candida jiufengensis]KAI5957331.1 hypothetical protein KGF54_000259 [Candida jiufengensis]
MYKSKKQQRKSLTLHDIFNDDNSKLKDKPPRFQATSTPIGFEKSPKKYIIKKKSKKQVKTLPDITNLPFASPESKPSKPQSKKPKVVTKGPIPGFNNLLDSIVKSKIVPSKILQPIQPKPKESRIYNINSPFKHQRKVGTPDLGHHNSFVSNLRSKNISTPYYHQRNKTFAAIDYTPTRPIINFNTRNSLSTISEKHSINYIMNESNDEFPQFYEEPPELGRNANPVSHEQPQIEFGYDFEYGNEDSFQQQEDKHEESFHMKEESDDTALTTSTTNTTKSLLELGGYYYSEDEIDNNKLQINIKQEHQPQSKNKHKVKKKPKEQLFIDESGSDTEINDDNDNDNDYETENESEKIRGKQYLNVVLIERSNSNSTKLMIYDSMDLLKCEESIIK